MQIMHAIMPDQKLRSGSTMNFSFQDPETRSPSFLGGFAEDTEEKGSFQTS